MTKSSKDNKRGAMPHKQKSKKVKIISITTYPIGHIGGTNGFIIHRIVGLGDDGKLYERDSKKWVLAKY